MFDAVDSPFLIPFDGRFELDRLPCAPPDEPTPEDRTSTSLATRTEELAELQKRLYAQNRWAVLLVFQAMDAAGKDGTIRAVMKGVDPAGCQVHSFKRPSAEELDHDFLWRTSRRLPERGRIGIFNRSYYEEVLVVRVHPEYLGAQRLPFETGLDTLWSRRFQSILAHERHLAESGVAIIKFFLNVSRGEQRERFRKRLENPDKRWKFSGHDVEESGHWTEYRNAFQQALATTSRPWAPWYSVPADNKPFMRSTVADIVVRSLQSLDPRYPQNEELTPETLREFRSLLAPIREH